MLDVIINGIPASKYKLIYAPDGSNLFQYAASSFKALEQSFEARRGGLFFGGSIGVKSFTLRFVVAPEMCNEKFHTLNDGYIRRVQDYLKLGKKCVLNFSDLSFIKYDIIITNMKFTYYNTVGFVVDCEAKCYDGVGYSTITTSTDSVVRNNSNILPGSFVVDSSSSNINTNTFFYKYNPGTVDSGAVIKIGAGSSWQGVLSIANASSGEVIHLNAHTAATTSNMTIDCNSHKIYYANPLAERFPMLIHKDGWIKLNPGDKVFIAGTVSGNDFITEELIDFEDYDSCVACKATTQTNQPVLTGISTVGDYRVLSFDKTPEPETEGTLEIVQRNNIYISSTSAFDIKNFDIECVPKYE